MTESLQEQPEQPQHALACRWNDCTQTFPNHAELAAHLSEDHIGWKKDGYFCNWNNCSRQCHNRFALTMHLRIHTGEKPFECEECGQAFGRMDALARHKKADHGITEKTNNPQPNIPQKRSSSSLDLQQSKKQKKEDLIPGSDYSRYRLAKAQLRYILRENEMLQDEYEIAQKKLKRMKTERRVLLDALMNREQDEDSNIQEDIMSNVKVA